MTGYLYTFTAIFLVFGLMMACLHFSGYKQGRSCCSGGACSKSGKTQSVRDWTRINTDKADFHG